MSGYSRQSVADIIAGEVVKAAPLNAEFNAIRDAFAFSGGHTHDGSSTEGAYVPLIADTDANNKVSVDTSNNRVGVFVEVSSNPVEQVRFQDGAIVPVTDNDIDLGTSGVEFKNLYLDGTANVDTLTVDENATVTGNLTVTGNATFNGNTTIGNAATDTVTVTADVASPLLPSADDTYDIGGVGIEWRNLYIDGTANIDSLIADTADINAGTIDNTAIGGSTPAAGAFTTVSASSTATLSGNATVGGTLGVTGATTLSSVTVSGNANFNGNTTLGNANTDTVTFTADIASDLLPSADGTYDLGAVGSEWQDLYVDGTANIDSLVADTADIDGGTIDGTTIGGNSAAVGTFTDLTSSGTSTHATVDINGGNIDGTTIGGSTPAAITGTTITANTNFVGDLTGDVTGNVTGNVSGNLTGNVTGNLTGNVTGNVTGNLSGDVTSTGTSSFATVTTSGNVTVGGDLTVNGTTTTISTTNTVVEDALIELGNGTSGSPTNDAGIVIERGSENNAFIGFDESADKFTMGTGTFTGASTGDLTITTGTLVVNVEGDLTGNADTATALETPRTIAGQSFDGTANISIAPTDLTGVTASAAEINILDGDTSATATTLVSTDTVVVNDAGTVKQVALSDFETFFETELDTLSNVTTVGALNSGSITSGFGSIDVGSSAISTTGTVTFGSITDGVITITGFVDEDNMTSDSATLVPTQQSVKKYVDDVAGTSNNVIGLTATGAELNTLDGDTTPVSVTLVGTDGFAVNDGGVTKLALISDIDTYVSSTTSTLTNKTLTSPTVSGLYLSDSGFVVEGSSADANETTVTFTNPTADNTITFPDASGTVLLDGDVVTVNLDGDVTDIYVTQEKTYTITDYNAFSTYSVSALLGTATISGDAITYTAPNSAGSETITVTKDGKDATFDLTILAAGVATPTNTSPADATTEVGSSQTLTASAFSALGPSDTHASSDWQLSDDAGFSNIVDSTTADAVNLTSWEVTGLTESTTYYWRVRYTGTNNGTSDWSTATSFTTSASFGPTVIGEAYGGGFYAGNIVQGGTEYYLIVAPKSSGESSSKQYKTANTSAPAATQTLNDGPGASASMNSATYPAAEFCEGLSIGGYTDWYLPSRDELEVCYRNLKPTTDSNSTSNRSKSAIAYPENDDDAADTMGVNRNSEPTGAAYTAGSPAQTSVTDFQSGGTEAFAAASYCASSEYSSTLAWRQVFDNGGQGSFTKTNSFYVRAVRRLAV